MLKSYILILCVCESFAKDIPIIGILSTEDIYPQYFGIFNSCIPASYIKYVESGGAQVTPIWIGQSDDYYERVINYTNGLLLPGGALNLLAPKGYGEAAKKLLEIAIKANNRGIYYPVWGTCLGFQTLPFAVNGLAITVPCYGVDRTWLPLDFDKDYRSGRLYREAPRHLIQSLKNKNLTCNGHKYCLIRSSFLKHGISTDWQILSTNKDSSNMEFISSMEHTKFPFYGVQFHPEVPAYEFTSKFVRNRPTAAVYSAQYFANFFVKEARRNDNNFPSMDVEKSALIYNYCPKYTGLHNKSKEQMYLFNEDDFKKTQLL